jgi:glycosyltransferase involved in cell wall biosynthesis
MNASLSIDQLQRGGAALQSGGGWMASLLSHLLEKTDYKLAAVSFGPTRRIISAYSDRISTVVIPEKWRATREGLCACRDIVNEWKPDIVHVHGTEEAYGLLSARGMITYPVVISLQGLVGPYSEWYHYFGNNRINEIIRMHRWLEIPALRGELISFLKFRMKAKREQEIITNNKYFIGRTAWDRAYVHALNPSAVYYYGGEILRKPFWNNHWRLENIHRHRIIFTNAGHPRKGTDLLLRSAKLLLTDYPDLQIRIAGNISKRNGYGRYIRRKFQKFGNNVFELGPLNAEQMAEELSTSHIFVSPSFIDNSPNAVCEAQLIGMPVISTYTGGVPSLIDDGHTGLFIPTGDAPMLAAKIREVFKNDELAIGLGNSAREVAVRRHDPDKIIFDTIATYKDILKEKA